MGSRVPTDGGRSCRILIVEDEFLIALAAEEILETAGFVVSGIASSFDQALALAEREHPDLVLMDIRLASKRDGIEAATEIRGRFGIPSIFTSANIDPAHVERARPARPAGWLSKPYPPEKLLQAVAEARRAP